MTTVPVRLRNPDGTNRNIGSLNPLNRREPVQTVTKLLLLAMFAFAARYSDDENLAGGSSTEKEGLEAGHQYATDARRLLSTLCSSA